MKSKWILAAACLLMMASCGPKPVKLLSLEGTRVNDVSTSVVEQTPTSVFVKNPPAPSDARYSRSGFAVYPAFTDWTPYKAIRWTVENKGDQPLAL